MINKDRLQEALKAEGLEIAEESAVKLLRIVFAEVQLSAADSENQILKGVAALLPMVEPLLVSELIDQIDGQDDR